METKLSLTEGQIVVERGSTDNFSNPQTKVLTSKYSVANDDTDGSDSDDGGGGSSDSDGS